MVRIRLFFIHPLICDKRLTLWDHKMQFLLFSNANIHEVMLGEALQDT